MLKNDININSSFSVSGPALTHSVTSRRACSLTHAQARTHVQTAATPLRKVMIHSSARAHRALTKALSLPREHPSLSMSDSLSACQARKKYTDPAGGLAVSLAQAAASSHS